MANIIITGMQWGDEGKGKIVDLLAPAFDAVTRFQGGHNAGHTVKFADRHFALHLIPSGIIHDSVRCVLGNGMVLSPETFFAELDRLAEAGVRPDGRLFISDRIQILLPEHTELDRRREEAKGKGSIGTTIRGIGPAYESKVARYGIRAVDLDSPHLAERLADLLTHQAGAVGEKKADPAAVAILVERCRAWGERLSPFITDTAVLLNRWIDEGQSILFEGAQGALLDVDHGTYPFVTSSNTTAGAASTGTGVPPTALDGTIGILKAYTTRVGAGPFVSELDDEVGEHLRKRGHEFGTTTGRPRRCGWLDLVVARHAARLNGVGAIALTKLDILDELDEIPVCVAWRIDGEAVEDYPASLEAQERAEPIYEVLPGWKRPTTGLLDYGELPGPARDYIRFVEERLGAPVVMVSSGPRREETILRTEQPALEHFTSGRLEKVLAERGG